jgi:hypothetical protein
MSAVINWTKSGAFGITARGYEICRAEHNGAVSWRVFNAFGNLIGSYADRAAAERAVR